MNRLPVYYAAFFTDTLLRRMLTYAIVLYGADALGAARWAGLLYFALVLPYLCSVHAGLVIDRTRKRTVLQAATLATVFLIAALWGTARAAVPSGAAIAALVLAYGLASAFTYPSFFAALPWVAPGRATRATVVMTILATLCYVAGPVTVGLLRSVTQWPGFFGALTLIAAASAAIVWTARVPLDAVEQQPRGGVRELLDYCQGHAPLRALLLATALFSGLAIGAVDVLLPLFADGPLQLSPRAAGAFLACGGAGTVAGAVVALRVFGRPRTGWWLCGSAMAGGFLLLAMTVVPAVVAAGLFFLSCVLGGLFGSLTIAGAQACAPTRLRGRILGLYTVTLGASPALGGLLSGILGDAVGTVAALQILAIAISITFAALFAAAPSLRQRDLVFEPAEPRRSSEALHA